MRAGVEICNKCTDPDHWDMVLFDTVLSQERFGVEAIVSQVL